MAKVTMTITLDEDFVEPVKEAILAAVDRAARFGATDSTATQRGFTFIPPWPIPMRPIERWEVDNGPARQSLDDYPRRSGCGS